MEMTIREPQILFPIVLCDVVPSGSEVIADGFTNRRIWLWPGRCVDTAESEESINRLSVNRREKLTFRISQSVVGCTGNVDRPRGNQAQQHVLVERKIVLTINEFAKAITITPGSVPD